MKPLVKTSTALLALLLPMFVTASPPSVSVPAEAETKVTETTLLKKEGDTTKFPLGKDEGGKVVKLSPDDYEFHDDAEDDVLVLRRLKRDFYDRDPWGRIPERRGPYYKRGYGRRPSRYNTRKYSRGRRRQHHVYRGPDYGDDYEDTKHRLTNVGYVDSSVFEQPSIKPSNIFVSARSSGVARTETTGSSL